MSITSSSKSLAIFSDGVFFSSDELDKFNLIDGKYHYMIKRIEKNKYEVRRLSNTRNSNVIFELDLKKNIEINNNVLIKRLIY